MTVHPDEYEEYLIILARLRQDVLEARQKLAILSNKLGLEVAQVLEIRAQVSRMAEAFGMSPTDTALTVWRIGAVIALENLLKPLEEMDYD